MMWESAVVQEVWIVGKQDAILSVSEREHIFIRMPCKTHLGNMRGAPPDACQEPRYGRVYAFVNKKPGLLTVLAVVRCLGACRLGYGLPGHHFSGRLAQNVETILLAIGGQRGLDAPVNVGCGEPTLLGRIVAHRLYDRQGRQIALAPSPGSAYMDA